MYINRLSVGLIKELRTKGTLLTISGYNKVINYHGAVIKLDKDFNMLESNNYVNLVRGKYKSFKISKYKIFRFDNDRIRVSFGYEEDLEWFDYQKILMKRNLNINLELY